MSSRDPEQLKAELEKMHGAWTAHSIHLGGDRYTFPPWFDTRLKRIVQNAGDVIGGSFDGLKVLDLAALEGQLGIEFALHGAEVVAIEGRETNLRKAEFAKDALRLDNLNLVLGDVRHLSRDLHGTFEIVLCAGILYHLDAADACELLADIASVCTRLAVIDTHVSTTEADSITWRGKTYFGSFGQEHPSHASEREVADSLWYSLDNRKNFKFTRDSLCNLLRHEGFTSVFESLVPYEAYHSLWPRDSGPVVELEDRLTLIAIKGGEQPILSSPIVDRQPQIDRLERSQVKEPPGLLERIGRRADRPLRRLFSRGSLRPARGSDLLLGRTRPGCSR